MSFRNITITVLIILILGGAGLFIISQKTGPQGSRGEEKEGNLITNLFPFLGEGGGGEETENSSGEGSSEGEVGGTGVEAELEMPRQLTTIPIAGFIATTTVRGPVVRYVERSTGNIYDVDGKSEAVRITNTTLPEIYEAVWNNDGTAVVLRYLNSNDVVKTYAARIVEPQKTATSTEARIATLEGTFLADDIAYLTTNQDRSQLLYLSQNQTGVSAFTSSFDLKNPIRVFSSNFSEWIVEWPRNNVLIATTRASYTAPGFAYAVNQKTGTFSKLIGDKEGLVTSANPDGTIIMYSVTIPKENRFATHILTRADDTSFPLSLSTLPEKCVWNPKRVHVAYCGVPTSIPASLNYPDSWYQGIMSFSDNVWEIDTMQNTVRIIASFEKYIETGVDITKPSVDQNGSIFYFIDKKDGTLWSVPLPKPIKTETGTTTPAS